MSGLHIYKRTQGKYTRLTTATSIVVIAAWGCYQLIDQMSVWTGGSIYVSFGVPLVLLLLAIGGAFWLVNRPKSADFLIATESEMKKVSWSSRKEVFGSTKVVVLTTFILAAVLFLVDLIFRGLFRAMGVS